MRERPEPNRDHAEWVALRVLGAIASDRVRLGRFLSFTGVEPQAVRACAEDPRFLASVVDYVADDDATLQAVISETGVHPNDIAMAQFALRELRPPASWTADRLPLPGRRYS